VGLTGVDAGLFGQLPDGGLGQVLVVAHEPAGQRPAPLERFDTPADGQHRQPVVPHRQHDQVDGDRRRLAEPTRIHRLRA